MKDNSFPRHFKLLKEKDFISVFRNGKKWEKKGIIKVWYKENGLNHPRLGISIPKKTGNAVFRNKLKRTIREWFRINKYHFKKKLDFVVIVKTETKNAISTDKIKIVLEKFLDTINNNDKKNTYIYN